MESILARDPKVALVVDTCDLATGQLFQVIARGEAEVLDFDAERARRWGARYLGSDEGSWGEFRETVFEDDSTRFVRLVPERLRANDLSYTPAGEAG